MSEIERAVSGGGLMLAYDHVDGNVPDKMKVAKRIQKELLKSGFELEWDGDTDKRICIPNFDWKHR